MGLVSGIRKKPISDPGFGSRGSQMHRIPDPDPQHWALFGLVEVPVPVFKPWDILITCTRQKVQLGFRWLIDIVIVLMTKNCANLQGKIFLIRNAIYLSLGLHKRLPSYRRSFQPSKEKRTSSTSKHKIFSLFYFCGALLPFGSGFGSCRQKSTRIRIRNTGLMIIIFFYDEPCGTGRYLFIAFSDWLILFIPRCTL